MSLYKEHAPVRAYSATGALAPDAERGMSAFIRAKLDLGLSGLESRIGPLDRAQPAQFRRVIPVDYRQTWQALLNAAANSRQPRPRGLGPSPVVAGGRVLLATSWHQDYPYNGQCPTISCNGAPRTPAVGCVPLAASQIMRHWCWPPLGAQPGYGPYDWTLMPGWFGTMFPSAQAVSVATLCRDAGRAVNADYACDGTGAYDSCWWAGCRSMEDAFKDTFRYTLTPTWDVSAFNGEDWFQGLKAELENNQPLEYALAGFHHSVALDGWQDIQIGSPPTTLHQCHVNYGWGGRDTWGTENTCWCTEDGIHGYDHDKDYRLANIRPDHALGPLLLGSVANDPNFPYHYVNVNAVASAGVQFAAGALVQFLPGTRLTSVGPASHSQPPLFSGQPSQGSRLFAYNDNGDGSVGIVVGNGALKLSNGGGLTLIPHLPPRLLCGFGTNSPAGQPNILLSWERAATDDDGVVVERQAQFSTAWAAIATVAEPITGFLDTDVRAGWDYAYRVRAIRGGRSSAPTPDITLRAP